MFNWLKKILNFDPSVYKEVSDVADTRLDTSSEGNFHSGPEGYSAQTSYPDSFYGSIGSNQAQDSDSDRQG